MTVQNVTWDGAVHQNVLLAPANLTPTMWASVPMTVGGTDVALVVQLRQGARVTGRIEFDGGVRPGGYDIERTLIEFSRTDGGRVVNWQVQIRVQPDGRFVATGLTPGAWRVGAGMLGWSLRFAALAGRDITAIRLRSDSRIAATWCSR
jgi:hypothetical protein